MTSGDKLVAPWLTAAPTQAVMAALEAARPGCARFVGGCVRNTLRASRVDDVDIATQLTPHTAMAALKAAGLRVEPTGIDHGTVTAIVGGEPFEITSLRRDVQTDGRRAVVAFTQDWTEDAQRRDFRLNAIYASADGTLHEGVAGGIADAVAGRVIFIGDADERLREDYLRILRFFRFNAWYGAGVDGEGLAACERQKDGLSRIAAERIWKEMKKLLAAPDPSDAVRAMDMSGVLEAVLPGARADGLPALVAAEAALERAPDAMRRLMALMVRRTRDVARLAKGLKLSNAETGRLLAWADPGLPALLGAGRTAQCAAVYWRGAGAVSDRILLEAAAGADVLAARDALDLVVGWTVPEFPLGGDDALACGLTGPAIGRALRALEQIWVEGDFEETRPALLNRLKALA